MNDSAQSVTRHSNLHKCISILLSLLMVMSCFGGLSFTAGAETILYSGDCGTNAHWKITDDGMLTVYGTGTMSDYSYNNHPPYYDYMDSITHLTIEDGITKIGNYAFYNFSGITGSLSIPNSVTTIGNYAFCNCSGFDGTLSLGSSLQKIGRAVFQGCSNLTGTLVFPDSITSIDYQAFYGCSGLTGTLDMSNLNNLSSISQFTFNGCSGFSSLVLPDNIVSIGASAFAGCTGFTGTLILPDTLTTISGRAFGNCSGFTGELVLPLSLTKIESQTFLGCSGFTGKLVIPNSVTEIASQAFDSCDGITSLVLGDSVEIIGNHSFTSMDSLSGTLVIPDSVKTIGNESFSWCKNLEGLVFGSSVESVGEKAFSCCFKLSGTLSYPANMTLGACAFHYAATDGDTIAFFENYPSLIRIEESGNWLKIYCSGCNTLEKGIRLPDDEELNLLVGQTHQLDASESGQGENLGIEYSSENTDIATVNDTGMVTGIANGTVNITVQSKTISSVRKTIRTTVRGGTTLVSDITVTPNPVALNIGNTQQLTLTFTPAEVTNQSVSYSSSNPDVATVSETGLVTAVGEGAATITVTANDGSGVAATVPVTVTDPSIIARGQCGNTAYWKIVDDGTDKTFTVYGTGDMWYSETWTGDAFDAWDITKIVIEEGITSIGRAAFGRDDFLYSERPSTSSCGGYTEFNNSYYEQKAFKNVENLIIPNSVTSIGDYAFQKCTGFTGNLVIPNSVTSIGNTAFRDCTGFNGTLTLGNNVQIIGTHAFYGCKNFTGSLVIPDSVISIGEYSFCQDYGFNGTLTLGNNVQTIGRYAFYMVSGFTGSLVIPNSVTSIGQSAFNSCTGFDGTLTLPNNLQTIDTQVFSNTGFTGDLTIPNSVTSIGDYAFNYCSGFNGTLTIGNNVQTIGGYAFRNCSGFTGSLVIPNSVTSIGERAFYSCTGFNDTLTIGNNVQTIGKMAFFNCFNFTGTLIIPDSVTSIGDCAFHKTASYINGSNTYNGKLEDCNTYKFFEYYRGDNPDDAYQFIEVVEGSRTEPTPTQNGTQIYKIYCADATHNGAQTSSTLMTTVNEPIEYVPTNVDVTNITITPNPLSVDIGSTQQLAVTVEPSNATNPAVTYTSSDTTVATVDANGLVTGVAEGTATITVTATDGSGVSQTVTVTVTDPSIIARGQCGDTAYWKITQDGDDKVFTVYGTGDMWNRERWTGDAFDAWDITKIVIEEGITSICENAFGSNSVTVKMQGQEYLEQTSFGGYEERGSDRIRTKIFENASGSLILPNSVVSIGSEAFAKCKKLNGTLILGNNVQTIMREAFLNCTGFTGSLTIPDSVISIGNSAFRDCTELNGSLVLGSSVQTIGSYAFGNCRNLTGILEIPTSVTSIGTEVFHGTASYTNGSSVYNGNLEDSNPYKFFEHYRGDSPDDDYQFIDVVEGERTEPTPSQNGTQVYKIYCCDSSHNGEHNDAYSSGHQKNLVATVNEPIEYIPVSNIAVAPSEVAINISETKQLSVTITPNNATNPAVTYTSSNTTVATVDENGLVTGIAEGTATVTITTVDGTGTPITIPVTVINPHTHTPGEPVHENDVRDDDNGTYTFELNTYCQDDSTLLGTEVVILDRTPAVEAVVGTDGHNEYFTDDKGTDDTSDDVIYVWNATEEKYELGAIIPTHIHNPGEPRHENDVRDDDAGAYTFELNTYCESEDPEVLLNSELVTLTLVPAVNAEPGTNGNIEYYEDEDGNKYIWDEDEDKYEPFNGDVTTHVHNPGTPVIENIVHDDDSETYSYDVVVYCTEDGDEISRDTVVLTKHDAVDAEPGTDGNIEYYEDEDGNKYIWDEDEDKYEPFSGDVTTHIHNPGTPVIENIVHNDDSGTYSYDVVVYCTEDGDEISRETVVLTKHDAVDAEPGADGNIEYYEDEDGNKYTWNDDEDKYVEVDDDDIVTHVHNPGTPVIENIVHDDDNEVYSYDVVVYCTEDGDKISRDTVVLTKHDAVDAEPGTDGNIEYYEDEDGNKYIWDEDEDKYVEVDDDDIVTHVHNPGTPVIENIVHDDDNEVYSYDIVVRCLEDGEVISRETFVLEKHDAVEAVPGTDGNIEYFEDGEGNKYTWDDDEDKYVPYNGDVTTHVHNPGTPVQENFVNDDATDTYSYDVVVYCTEDGDEISRETIVLEKHDEVPAQPGTDGTKEYFEDEDGNKYVWDEDEGKYEPVDDDDLVTHVHNPGTPTKENYVRDDDNNVYSYDIVVRCLEDNEVVSRETVVLTKHDAVEAVPGTDGNIEYFEDGESNKYVWDDDENEYVPYDGDITTHEHNPGTPVKENFINDDTTGTYRYDVVVYCTEDGDEISRETVELTKHDAVEAEINQPGNVEYYEDEDGNKYAWDDDANEYVELTTDVTTEVEMTKHDAVEATNEHDGNIEYYTAPNGDIYIKGEDGQYVPSTIEDVTTHFAGEPVHENDKHNDATGEYSYDLVTYCANCDEELARETVVLTKHEATDPSENSDGNVEYYEDKDGSKYIYDDETGTFVPASDTDVVVPRTPVTSITLTADRTALDYDTARSAQITVTVNPSDATNKKVTFASSDNSVVTVDSNGRVTVVGKGTATVTVTSKSNPEVKATITFTVNKDTYRIDGPDASNIGDSGRFTLYTDTARPYYFKFFTSDASMIEVDEETGEYRVLKAGNATITARIYFGDGTTKEVTKSFRCVDPDAGKYRCKMCDTYEAMKDAPIVGIFYTIVHFFVHLAHSIGYAT